MYLNPSTKVNPQLAPYFAVVRETLGGQLSFPHSMDLEIYSSWTVRQIIWKASEPVSDRVRPEPGWHRYIIAVSNSSAHAAHFNSAVYTALLLIANHLVRLIPAM